MNPYSAGMKRTRLLALIAAMLFFTQAACAAGVHPEKLSSTDLAGAVFEDPGTMITEADGGTILDFTSLKSSDGKFASGVYKAGPQRFEITEPYGVDEFMYFLEGDVTLTSNDGTVIKVNAGEAVTVPKEFTGTWETKGYRKIWVIYSASGEGL